MCNARKSVHILCRAKRVCVREEARRRVCRFPTFRFCGAEALSGPVHYDNSGSQSLTTPAGMQRPVVFAEGCQIRPPLRSVTGGVRVSRVRVAEPWRAGRSLGCSRNECVRVVASLVRRWSERARRTPDGRLARRAQDLASSVLNDFTANFRPKCELSAN